MRINLKKKFINLKKKIHKFFFLPMVDKSVPMGTVLNILQKNFFQNISK